MALALKKKKEEDERKTALNEVEEPKAADDRRKANHVPATQQTLDLTTDGERGRRIDKGKAKVSVVGFDGQNSDDVDDSE